MRLIDADKKFMKMPSPKTHLAILDLLNETNKFTLITASRGFSKTTLVNQIWLPNYIMETKKKEFILIVSNSTAKAKGILNDTKSALNMIINAGFKMKKIKWNNVIEIINENNVSIHIESRSVTQDIRGEKRDFLRPSLIICDDIESKAMSSPFNTKTANGRGKLKDFFYSDLLPSMSEDGRIIVVGTILHKDSLIANLLSNKSWKSLVVPVYENGVSNWKSRFPLTKQDALEINKGKNFNELITSIEEIKEQWFSEGKHSEFYQEYLCQPVADEKKIFNPSDFKYFKGLSWGENEFFKIENSLETQTLVIRKPISVLLEDREIGINEFVIKCSMDLASDGTDESVIIVGGMFENKLYMIEALGGHWSPFQKVCAVLEVVKTYKPIAFGIEKAGAQNDFFYTAKVASEQYKTPIPIVSLFHKGRAKNIRIAALEPYFKTGGIILNAKCKNLNKLESELIDFDIDTEAKKDNYCDALAYQLQMFYGLGADNEDYIPPSKIIRSYY